jgi:hypothetical protein
VEIVAVEDGERADIVLRRACRGKQKGGEGGNDEALHRLFQLSQSFVKCL